MTAETPTLLAVDESSVDENARKRFEAAWQEGRPEPIERFLPAASHGQYQATLEELVHIELELAWKAWGQSAVKPGSPVGRPARVESYLERFPRLNQASVVLRMLEQEYQVRHQYGDRPSSAEYRERFPELVVDGREVDKTQPEGGPAPQDLPRIPGYQVLGFLGRGGMGVVYKGRQVGLNRLVALKMIQAGGAASPEELARFRTEAEAVARLQHPNIVQIHEVGEQQGRPFFSLEFVAGGTLAERLAGTPQPPRGAAELVETLARAIHAAHQRGIVHRDLKPANVLLQQDLTRRRKGAKEEHNPKTEAENIGASGAFPPFSSDLCALASLREVLPKITDFGLAKLLDGEAGQTTTGAPLGTPSYMAPEQARGQKDRIGPAADVYALGAILYELLTGRPPFRAETALSTLEQVRELDPVPPRRLQPKVPGDLETICLKCLQKEPQRRYATALELADDLRRFQAGEPVRARPTPAWERGLKWAKRRPALAALLGVSGAAALTVLVVVLVANARLKRQWEYADEKRREAETQRQQARANFRQARQAVDELLTRVGHERLAHLPHMEQVRRELLEAAVRYYREFVHQAGDDPEVRYEAGRDFRMLGKIYAQLGRGNEAEQAFREGVTLNQKLTADFPNKPIYQHELARGYHELGALLRAKQPKDAEEYFYRALRLQKKLVAESPDRPEYQSSLGGDYNGLGLSLVQTGQRPDAEKAFRAAIAPLKKLVADDPSVVQYQSDLAICNNNLANLLAETNRPRDAEKLWRENLDLWKQLAERDPSVPDHRSKLALTCSNLGLFLQKHNRPQDAEPLIREAVDLRQKLADDFPSSPYGQIALAGELDKLAVLVVVNRGEWAEGRRLRERAVGCTRLALKMEPGNPDYREQLRGRWWGLADILIQLQDHAGAARAAQELPPVFPDRWKPCYEAARLLTRCVPLAEKDGKLSEVERQQLAQAYAGRAVELMGETIRKGYKDLDWLRKDPGLDVLRSRDDFKKLLHELAEEHKAKAK
jgi:serine/threonine protein kinase